MSHWNWSFIASRSFWLEWVWSLRFSRQHSFIHFFFCFPALKLNKLSCPLIPLTLKFRPSRNGWISYMNQILCIFNIPFCSKNYHNHDIFSLSPRNLCRMPSPSRDKIVEISLDLTSWSWLRTSKTLHPSSHWRHPWLVCLQAWFLAIR